jgi:hypothetical protein
MSKTPPLRFRDDPAASRSLRDGLAQAGRSDAPYDVSAGLARLERSLALGAVATTGASHASHASHASAAGSATSGASKTVLGAALKGGLLGVVFVGGAVLVERPARVGPETGAAVADAVVRVAPRAGDVGTSDRAVEQGAAVIAAPPPVASVMAKISSAPVGVRPSPSADSTELPEGAKPNASSEPVPPSAPRPAPEDKLAAEMDLLARLRAVGDGDPARALAIAAEGDQRFPGGVFTQEREAISIGALVRLGRTGEARARASSFLAAYPRSSFAERIKRTIGVAP